jgi:3-hydroxypropanoate dehydrogenase
MSHAPLSLNTLFEQARTAYAFEDRPVPESLLRQIYDHCRWGPTSANSNPARFVFVRSYEAKARLLDCVNLGNVAKVQSAPVVVIVAADTQFYDEMPKLFPSRNLRDAFVGNQPVIDDLLARNVPLQGAYFMIAARALGLDCGPMSGFDAARLDAAFFSDGRCRSNFICTLGYADRSADYPRNPRLEFDEACRFE